VVTIILVDKDKNQLVQEHEQLGAKAGKDKTDKFLIQSSVITKERYDSMRDFNQKELPEQLTNMWIKIAEEEKLG
jgi:hypothetical protein